MISASELNAVRATIIERITWGRGFVSKLIESIPDEHLTARAGGCGNHTLWITGHLANTEDGLISMMDGGPRALDDAWAQLFGMGSTPVDDAGAYPSRADLTAALDTSRARHLRWLQAMTPETAKTPLPEQMRMFAPDTLALPLAMLAHEWLHGGQLTAIRATLDLPKLVG